MKKFLKSPTGQKFVGFVIASLVRIIRWTSRVEYVGLEHLKGLDYPVIYTAWHGRMIMLPYMAKRPLFTLSSEHRDGRLMHYSAKRFSIHTIDGSSSKNGSRALRNMLKTLKKGGNMFITPDGPKGPAMQAKPGVAEVARMSGAVVVPMSCSATRKWVFKSWDTFTLPKPFSRIFIVYGAPITVTKTDDRNEALQHIEHHMNLTQQEADRLCS